MHHNKNPSMGPRHSLPIKFCTRIGAILTFFSIVLGYFPGPTFSKEILDKDPMALEDSALKAVMKGKIFVKTQMTSGTSLNSTKWQNLEYIIAGLHSVSCHQGLRKLSLYENYHQLIPEYISASKYDEAQQNLFFKLEHKLLPHTFTLSFKLPRIKAPGLYEFTFEKGIFPGLTGTIQVKEEKGQCLYITHASWKGHHTGYPDTVIELFSNTLSRLAMEKLFRLSKI